VTDNSSVPATLRALLQLNARRVKGGRPHLLREQELLRQAGPRLRGKRPAHITYTGWNHSSPGMAGGMFERDCT
jgi:hypothetical protein